MFYYSLGRSTRSAYVSRIPSLIKSTSAAAGWVWSVFLACLWAADFEVAQSLFNGIPRWHLAYLSERTRQPLTHVFINARTEIKIFSVEVFVGSTTFTWHETKASAWESSQDDSYNTWKNRKNVGQVSCCMLARFFSSSLCQDIKDKLKKEKRNGLQSWSSPLTTSNTKGRKRAGFGSRGCLCTRCVKHYRAQSCSCASR